MILEPFAGFRVDRCLRHVSDLNLIAIGRAELLSQVYGTVLIPPAVAAELRRYGFDTSGACWLEVKAPGDEALT